MYICLCNAIKERDINDVLKQDTSGNTTVSRVYSACTDGEKPQCACCIQTLRDMVCEHKARCAGAGTA